MGKLIHLTLSGKVNSFEVSLIIDLTSQQTVYEKDQVLIGG